MAVWVVRSGREGEYEELCLSQSLAAIDFDLGQSVADFGSREALREHASGMRAADQLWNFMHVISIGDMIVLPRKHPRVVNVGRVTSEYEYRENLEAPHVRSVEWDQRDIPRSYFDQDLLNSMGGLATVFQIRANDAEARLSSILAGYLSPDVSDDPGTAYPDSEIAEPRTDLEEQINDRIVERIRSRFPGTRLEMLIAEILRASGYRALVTRQGPDGGIDVLAGQGEMGFDSPRICVQVKSGRHPVDIQDYNRLLGNITQFGAQHGLLVSLGDFTRAVRNENERSFFQIRLWGADDLVEKLLETYDRLPESIQSEIPLRIRRVLIETE